MRRYQHLAFAHALSMLPDFHLAQDATQEAFLHAHRCLSSLHEPRAFPGWLRGIVRHQCHRILRRKRRDTLPLTSAAEGTAAAVEHPADAIQRRDDRLDVLAALRALPPQQRQIIAMFYLHEHTQREVAEFLGLPVSTVNNRLHAARQALRRKVMTMTKDAIRDHALPDDFPQRIGKIIEARGPVAEVRFGGEPPPDIFDALVMLDDGGQEGATLHVVQRLPGGGARALVLAPHDGVTAGMRVVDRGPLARFWKPGTPLGRFTAAKLAPAVAALGHPPSAATELLETGVKSIDLLCPLPRRGNVGLFGPQGVGRVVLLEELAHRLGESPADLRLFCLVHHQEPHDVREMLAVESGYPGGVADGLQTLWLLSETATDPFYAAESPFDASLYFSPLVAVQGLYPALDPLVSNSKLLSPSIVGDEHCEAATQVRESLRRAKELMTDAVLLELLACRAVARARQRVAEWVPQRLAQLNQHDRLLIERARKLERFLTTPFFAAEVFTGLAGRRVPREKTVRACRGILDGKFDHLPEEAFAYVGGVGEAVEKPRSAAAAG